MERPFYVSDEVLNTALVGIDNKALNSAALPETLHEAVAAITALDQEPADTAWALTSLVFAYESAYNNCRVNSFSPEQMTQYRAALAAGADAEGAANADAAGSANADAAGPTTADAAGKSTAENAASDDAATLVTRIKLHQGPLPVAPCAPEPSGQRYLSSEIMSLLNNYRSNSVAWLAILARLHGTGLKVPLTQLKSFLDTYFKLRPELSSLYVALPLAFLPQRAHYLLPYLSAAAARSRDDEAGADESIVEPTGEPGTEAWYAHITAQWRHGSAAERKGAVATLLERYELERVLDLIEPDFKTLAAKERAELLELLLNNWSAQLTHCYQAGTWAHDSALAQRLATWLEDLVAKDRATTVKTAASQLLRLLPDVGWQDDMIALARKVYKATWKKDKLTLTYQVDVTNEEVVTALCTFFPELKDVLDYLKKYPNDAHYRGSEEAYFRGFTFLVPPALWFELFALERCGDDAVDADKLFATFAQHFPGWIVQKQGYHSWRFANCFAYLITRIRFELGEVYLKAFYQHCGAMLPLDVVHDYIAGTSYAEREHLPYVRNPELYQQFSTTESHHLLNLCNWTLSLASEPAACWGPKFSAFFSEQLLACFASKSLAKAGMISYNHYNHYFEPCFSAIGLGLEPKVKALFCLRLKGRIAELNAEIAEREKLIEPLKIAQTREDIALRERYSREVQVRKDAVDVIKHLVEACGTAERLKKLCAAEVERACLVAFEA